MSPDKDTAGGGHRLAPVPFRVPVDPAATRTFGRPRGVDGSFVAEELRPAKFRQSTEFAPTEKPSDPILQEAFSRPHPGGESLQRHPADAGALAAGADVNDDPVDPWRVIRPPRPLWAPRR